MHVAFVKVMPNYWTPFWKKILFMHNVTFQVLAFDEINLKIYPKLGIYNFVVNGTSGMFFS
jgi:hypothetical protein